MFNDKFEREEHLAELADHVVRGGTIWAKDGSGKLSHADFMEYAKVWYEMPNNALQSLCMAWTDEDGEHEVSLMESMLESICDCAAEFVCSETEDYTDWSTIQEENFGG